jgi:undecaprenyl-diphosphatase
MIEYLNTYDTKLFLFLNSHHNTFWDAVFWSFSHTLVWIPLYAFILAVILIKYKKHSWLVLLSVIVLITMSDQISSGIIKFLVERLRPSHNPELAGLVHIVRNYKGELYGFVSSHAANTFAVAVFIALLFRNKIYSWCIFIWPISVSYSRIYLGVHYPGDILGGALVGIGCGFLIYYLFKKIIESDYFSTNKHSP